MFLGIIESIKKKLETSNLTFVDTLNVLEQVECSENECNSTINNIFSCIFMKFFSACLHAYLTIKMHINPVFNYNTYQLIYLLIYLAVVIKCMFSLDRAGAHSPTGR